MLQQQHTMLEKLKTNETNVLWLKGILMIKLLKQVKRMKCVHSEYLKKIHLNRTCNNQCS